MNLDDKILRKKFVKSISRKKESKTSFVDETIAGAITPLGTDAQGNPPKKSKKKVLDDNAKTQGKSFGNAKPIEEAIQLLSELFE